MVEMMFLLTFFFHVGTDDNVFTIFFFVWNG